MARHRVFDRKRSGKLYWTVSPRGVMTLHATVWITPRGGLTTIPTIIPSDNHDSSAL